MVAGAVSISAVGCRSWRAVSRRVITIETTGALPGGLDVSIAHREMLHFLHIFVKLLGKASYRLLLFLLPAFLVGFLPSIKSLFVMSCAMVTVP